MPDINVSPDGRFAVVPDDDDPGVVSNVVEVRGLTKRYGAITAVDGIDFSVRRGAPGC